MKAATIIAVAVAAFSSFPSTAQPSRDEQPAKALISPQQNPSSTTTPSSPAQAPSEPASAQSQGPINRNTPAVQLAPVKGELEGKLDSNSTKQGDSVVVKTEESVKTASGTEIPKGSKLVGHVTNVMARGDGKQNSQIAIQFDHAELKGGQNLPIESVIQSVAPAGGGDTTNSMSPMGGAPTGGAAMSGAPGAAGSEPNMPSGSTAGNPGMSNSASNQNTMNNRPSMAGNTTAQPGAPEPNTNSGAPAPGSIVARNGNVAIRATAIPGVLIANDINGRPFSNASGLLLGARRDIKLDGGTQMVVGVAEAPSGTGR